MLITGSCHCRNLSFTLDWQPEPTEIPARACGCSFCVKHGGVWTSCPTGRLRVVVKRPERVGAMNSGRKPRSSMSARNAASCLVVTSQIAGRLYAVVSVNAFDNVDAAILKRSPASFDGENESDRLARRQRNWIGDVEFVS